MAKKTAATSESETGEGTQEEQGEARTFTQEELNVLVGRARIEERQKYGDFEVLKAEAEEGRKLKLAQMTETERLQVELAEAQRKAIDADERTASAMIQSEIKVKAAQMGIVDPDAAVLLVDRTAIVYSEDSGVKGVPEALNALMEAKPYLKAHSGAANLNPGANTTARQAPVLTPEQKRVAERLGVREEDYAKHLRTP